MGAQLRRLVKKRKLVLFECGRSSRVAAWEKGGVGEERRAKDWANSITVLQLRMNGSGLGSVFKQLS